ncbi:methyl-accepting chemotaxis protein [Stagnihabitans tardus]|uniref:HAMP domain-containing protein n=1 Tax=Stagnihabitans tardus TaxID=2699202 RepID=A0AAE4YBH7_9RHOB|nr:methyl-accepting chemotaxis protein [Stagnihabitans tardus]NBZ86610.1 HAMP domain-containing protein [Stagnihabitans tardus]
MLRKIPIRTALYIIGAISMLAVMAIAGLWGLAFYQSSLSYDRQVILGQVTRHTVTTDMFHEGIEAATVTGVLTGPNATPGEKEKARERLESAIAGIEAEFAMLEAIDDFPTLSARVDAARPMVETYVKTARSTVDIALQDVAMGRAQLPSFMDSFSKLEVELAAMAEEVENVSTALQEENRGKTKLYGLLGGVGALIAMAMMGISAWKLTQMIVTPMGRLRRALAQVASGDFAFRIGSITRNDDIGAIARDIDRVSERVVAMMAERDAQQDEAAQIIAALGQGLRDLAQGNLAAEITGNFTGSYDSLRSDFNQAAQQLRQSIHQVVEVSTTIRAQSSDLSRASENLASRTENQAATLEETAAALEQVTGGMNSAASNAREVEEVVQRARNEVEHSGTVVLSAVSAMHEIEASSSQISQIIGVIDDIAFQTNLLALNAGVEAARAGDAGRGFAVVASEVRALAQRSSTAAKEIKGLIGASAQQVEKGVQQVDQARSALNAVVTQVARISDLVSQIARGSGEQARALHEINLGVAQLDQVTQQNAAMAEESGAASRAVEEEAMDLDRIVSRFALGRTKGAAKAAPKPAPSQDEGGGWIAA